MQCKFSCEPKRATQRWESTDLHGPRKKLPRLCMVGQAGQGSVEPTWSAEAEMSEAKIRLRWL